MNGASLQGDTERCGFHSIRILEGIMSMHIIRGQDYASRACGGCAAKRNLRVVSIDEVGINQSERDYIALARRRAMEAPEAGRLSIARIVNIGSGNVRA